MSNDGTGRMNASCHDAFGSSFRTKRNSDCSEGLGCRLIGRLIHIHFVTKCLRNDVLSVEWNACRLTINTAGLYRHERTRRGLSIARDLTAPHFWALRYKRLIERATIGAASVSHCCRLLIRSMARVEKAQTLSSGHRSSFRINLSINI